MQLYATKNVSEVDPERFYSATEHFLVMLHCIAFCYKALCRAHLMGLSSCLTSADPRYTDTFLYQLQKLRI